MEQERTARDKEIRKLMNVLARMGRTARMNQWTAGDAVDPRSVEQYNRIVERLGTFDEAVKTLFSPLPENTTWGALANACSELSAYYQDEAPSSRPGWPGVWADPKRGIWIDKHAFWHGMPQEVGELGDFMREKIAEWQELQKRKRGQ